MGTIGKLQILIAMKFLNLKNTKFYSREIEWVYCIIVYYVMLPFIINFPKGSVLTIRFKNSNR